MANLRVALLRTASSFVAHWPEIEDLRARCAAGDDVLSDPLHFLASTSSHRRSCSAVCWDGDRLIGLLYCTEHCLGPWRTGYAVAGDFTGRGALVCLVEDERRVLQACISLILSSGVHSLHVRHVPRIEESIDLPHLTSAQFDATITGDRIRLGPSYEMFLGGLGQHTRRNLRYYRRKAAEAELAFDATVSQPEFELERKRLNDRSHFRANRLHTDRDDRWMALHGGGSRMALRDASGTPVALMCGFAHRSCFYLLTQWNDSALAALSLSNVLRAHLAEHLIQVGMSELVFVGGTTLAFGRFCEPHPYQLLLVDKRRGLLAHAKRLLARACQRRAARGKPLPFALETLAGAHLERSRLEERTALGYALRSGSAPASPA